MSQNLDQDNFDQVTGEKPKRGQQPQGMTDNGRIIGAVVLIGLGIVFLLKQYGINIPLLNNWWAFFILIPAVGALWAGFTSYNRAGRWTAEARGEIGTGLIVALVALIFLFQLDWGKVWPLFLIVPGILLLFGRGEPRRDRYQ